MLARILAKARESSSLDRALFSRLVDIEEPRLQALESGEAEPTPSEVDRWAQTLGLRVKDLLAGAAERAPMALLLRSAYAEGRPSLDEIEVTGTHKRLGAFLRAVRDLAELEERLGRPAPPPLPRPAAPPSQGFPGEYQARSVRDALGLGVEPIPSMRRLLVDRLGVQLFFVTPGNEEDELNPSIDGAVTRFPRPAILVNLIADWWRTRMTLAHELAHLLFDDTHEVLFSPDRPFLKKPQESWRWQLFPDFDDIEVRADAFAACFLAPAEGVRRLVGTLAPSSEAAIGAVGSHFGVGRTVAINRLHHVFSLAPQVRAEMEARHRRHYEADFSADRVTEGIGLRSGALVPLVTEALQAKKIGKVRAWECLGLPLTEPAPMLPKEFQNPPVAREQQLVAAAQRYLLDHYPGRLLHALRAQRQGEQWRVELAEGGVGELELADAGILSLQDDGRVLAEDVRDASLPA